MVCKLCTNRSSLDYENNMLFDLSYDISVDQCLDREYFPALVEESENRREDPLEFPLVTLLDLLWVDGSHQVLTVTHDFHRFLHYHPLYVCL